MGENAYADAVPDRISETIAINGKATRLANDVPQSKRILTSLKGRTITENYNPHTVVIETIKVPGLYDTVYGYDRQGLSVRTDTRESKLSGVMGDPGRSWPDAGRSTVARKPNRAFTFSMKDLLPASVK